MRPKARMTMESLLGGYIDITITLGGKQQHWWCRSREELRVVLQPNKVPSSIRHCDTTPGEKELNTISIQVHCKPKKDQVIWRMNIWGRTIDGCTIQIILENPYSNYSRHTNPVQDDASEDRTDPRAAQIKNRDAHLSRPASWIYAWRITQRSTSQIREGRWQQSLTQG